ncbi:hypothetical protein QBC38DRAFT_412643 [Podospora fimiseda]|uniref:Ataxin-10 homolog n=1 Tax=Podospora fimiseda TaxID=252190 RepID=A0AAN7BTL1_9PEZI|nr:hypothetical protein QBC38DRAFT_412643 [Podospora fimiseda]
MASPSVPAEQDAPPVHEKERRPVSIEELCFTSAMSCYEGWLKLDPAIGPRTMQHIEKFFQRTFDKTLESKEVRESLATSVEVWIWLTRDFAAAIPSLTTRSIGPLSSLNDPDKGVTPQESTALITKNYRSLREDLNALLKLMHIARNLEVITDHYIPQELTAASQFDQMLYQTIILCINVTSKAYDGDVLDDTSRQNISEINELYKKLLVACLQQAQNWLNKNDRNKMSFWSTILFDEENMEENNIYGDFRPDVAKAEVANWYERNARLSPKTRHLLIDYEENIASRGLPPGHLPCISPLAGNWLPDSAGFQLRTDAENVKITPQWKADEPDKFKQDQLYGRVSREVDTWWLKARDPNYDSWVVPMPTVEFAQQRTENCKANLINRYAHTYRTEEQEVEGSVHSGDDGQVPEGSVEQEGKDGGHYAHDYNDDMIEEEDMDDDDSYGEGPMSGLLTEVPNILDPNQIEALHLIVKNCISDTPGGGSITKTGENLAKTRCRMFLALECGRSLLREILVFIAVWEKNETSTIFLLTVQIIEAIHNNALIPFAWQSLRIPKDIISPAQTVLLRLLNTMYRNRNLDQPAHDSKEQLQDIRLLHFLFIQFRSRIVPECAALMHLQAQIRNNLCDPADFPVDSWDMERAKDGLQQFLELFTTVTEYLHTRTYLIEWEMVYELVVLLKGLDAGVPKKPMVDPATRPNPPTDQEGYDSEDHPLAPQPPIQEAAYQFPWAGIKGPILNILAGLLQPEYTHGPGHPGVQDQVLRHNGMVLLLGCCVYDDHNRFARERVQLCLKFLLHGSDEANHTLRSLVTMPPPPAPPGPPNASSPAGAPPIQSVRVDGIPGEVRVRTKAPGEPMPQLMTPASRSLPPLMPTTSSNSPGNGGGARNGNNNVLPPIIQSSAANQAVTATTNNTRSRSEELLRDIITLADEAARLAIGGCDEMDGDETEEDDDFM